MIVLKGKENATTNVFNCRASTITTKSVE